MHCHGWWNLKKGDRFCSLFHIIAQEINYCDIIHEQSSAHLQEIKLSYFSLHELTICLDFLSLL